MCTSFFFSSRRRHTRWPRDWSSDVCSSDLTWEQIGRAVGISRQSAHERWARNPSPPDAAQQLLIEEDMLTFRGARPTMQSRQMLEPSAPTSQPATREGEEDRKSTRLNSSHVASSYAVFRFK